MLAATRSHENDDTVGGESDGTSGTLALAESDADVVSRSADVEELSTKPTSPRKNNPPALIQLSLALRSELKKLQQVSTRGSWCLS